MILGWLDFVVTGLQPSSVVEISHSFDLKVSTNLLQDSHEVHESDD